MAIHKTAALAAFLAAILAPAAYPQFDLGATDGTTGVSRSASPRRRTVQAGGMALALAAVAAAVASEYRGRRR